MQWKKPSPRAKPKTSASQQIDALRRALAREKTARKSEAAGRDLVEQRLSAELDGKTRDLRIALDQEAATGEILNIIRQSPGDVQPVFEAILKTSIRLLGGFSGAVSRINDGIQEVVSFLSLGGK